MKKRSLRTTIPHTSVATMVGVGLLVMACEGERPTVPPAEADAAAEAAANEATASSAAKVVVFRRDGGADGAVTVELGTSETRDQAPRPLIVVDGVIVPPDTDIQHMDISSIEIVRGGAAEARYGPRAANGVISITTASQGSADSSPESPSESISESPPESGPQPFFTPYEVAPEMTNRDAVQRALVAAYPAHLRDAGIGGRVVVHAFINEAGVVDAVLVSDSSGHSELDSAALQVARAFEFTPARNRDMGVAVWVQISIQFAAR